jgi:hypothetical protein
LLGESSPDGKGGDSSQDVSSKRISVKGPLGNRNVQRFADSFARHDLMSSYTLALLARWYPHTVRRRDIGVRQFG